MDPGRVVLITGAARGLGRAAAEHFLARGARVAVHARTGKAPVHPNAIAVSGDLRDAHVIRDIVDRTVAAFGRLDVLVNNAAAAYSTRFDRIAETEWREVVDVNLTAPFLLMQAALPHMKAQGFGRVINISSLAGQSVSTLAGAHYTASKAGLQGLTRAAAKELGPFGITVNAICPGLFDTELTHKNANDEKLAALQAMWPVARLGRPEEVAALIAFLASEEAAYITGVSIDINGGAFMI